MNLLNHLLIKKNVYNLVNSTKTAHAYHGLMLQDMKNTKNCSGD